MFMLHIEQDMTKHSTANAVSQSKKRAMLASLGELTQRMPLLLEIDHPCAQRHIADAHRLVEVCESCPIRLDCILFFFFLLSSIVP